MPLLGDEDGLANQAVVPAVGSHRPRSGPGKRVFVGIRRQAEVSGRGGAGLGEAAEAEPEKYQPLVDEMDRTGRNMLCRMESLDQWLRASGFRVGGELQTS